VRGVFYAFLCYTTVELLVGAHSGSSGEKGKTAAVLDWPAGRWLVGALGIGLIGWGIGSAYRGITKKFKDDLHTERMSARTERWITRAGVVGYLSRAVVYALIGSSSYAPPGNTTRTKPWVSTARCRSWPIRRSDRSSSASSRPGSLPTASSTSCAPPTAKSEAPEVQRVTRRMRLFELSAM
jgi:hypothetical protein